MSVANPLTAGSDIARSAALITRSPKETPLKPDLGVFESDVIKVSKLGLEKQQKEAQIEASSEIEDIANEVIRISSTIGKAKSVGNLTHTQAIDAYNKIADLL